MKLRTNKVNERYGTALFQLVSQENQLNEIVLEVRKLREFIAEYPNLWGNFTHPGISVFSQEKIILKICELFKLHILIKNFLLLLSKNRRLNLLEDILKSFESMCQKKQNIIECFIESAVSFSQEEVEELKMHLEKSLNRKIELHASTNRTLLGGFVFRMNNNLLDFSLKSRLFKIKQVMKG